MQGATEEMQARQSEASKTSKDEGHDVAAADGGTEYACKIAVSNKSKTALDVKHSVIDVLGPLREAEAYHEDNTRASLILAQHQRIVYLEAELKEVWDLVKKLRGQVGQKSLKKKRFVSG